jgi:hypothetical protein
VLKAQEGWEDSAIAEFAEYYAGHLRAPGIHREAPAIYHYHEAKEKERLYNRRRSGAGITRAEVEAELFAAELGVLLSFIPESGQILRLGSRVVKGAVKGEIRLAVRIVSRALTRRVTLDMMNALKGNLALSFAKAMTTAQVMNMFLGKLLIEPAIKQMQHDLASYEQIVAMANET